jgi:peptide/nickel transport system ATP-binding protein/peptide/nickel transport system permease protein
MSAVPVAADEVVGATAAAESPRFLHRLLRRKLALACLSYLAVVVGVAVVAPIALPQVVGESAGDLLAVRQGPSWDHLLGTDTLGRDVLDRLLVGARPTLLGVVEALIVVLAIGVPVGLAAGYFGGWVDRIVGWLADLSFSMPGIIIILVVLAVFPQSMTTGMVTLGVLAAPYFMRVVRSATLPVREEVYIAAARVSGLSRSYIISRHVLPRIAGPVIVLASMFSAAALLTQTGLAFLNLIVAAPAPSWGGMVADGIGAIELQPWLIWPPGLAIAITILAFGLLGDAIRDASTEGWSAPVRQKRKLPTVSAPTSELPTAPHHGAAPISEPPAAPHDGAASSVPLLSIQGLSVAFSSPTGSVRVVEDVSFDIRAGETVGVVGESGCGKSASAMAILGVLPGAGRIEAGRILLEGRDLAALSERELERVRGKEIGLISQEPMISLNPAFRVGWQVAEAVRRHHGVSRRAAKRRAIELLRRVHLPDPEAVARRFPHELSGGMAQRVVTARALAGEPKLLIADEPTTALDVTVQAEILELLRELQRERQMAILLVTHDWGVVADLCDRAVVMYAGQVVERADLLAMFRQPLHPYTQALLASNPHNLIGTEMLPTIPGSVPKPGQWPAGCHFHPRCTYATAACRKRPIPLETPADSRQTRCIHHEQLIAAR